MPSFKVMDVVAQAAALERDGKSIYHLEVGQPQSTAPAHALAAVNAAIASGDRLGYTPANGERPLREAIAQMYLDTYGVAVPAERVHVTIGSSSGFTLSFLAAFDVGDAVAIPMCSYPCYRNILQTLGVQVVPLETDDCYKLTAALLKSSVNARRKSGLPPLKGLILSSPANPTGVMLTPDEVRGLCATCDENGILFCSDEIYHGISYKDAPRAATALEFSQQALVINSFSKYYSMTGWRIGWLVAPVELSDAINRLNQNLFISAPTASQRAALAALQPAAKPELEGHVARYEQNRQVVLDALARMGITDVAPAHGAFYIYVDLGRFGVTDSAAFSAKLLDEIGVALTPGIDFEYPGSGRGERRIRLSFCGATADIEAGMQKLAGWWEQYLGHA
uniref:Aminotransferase class I/classII large domain-containing protein n=1 Tax=Coccolithus braarudii TaxID=221442 RepID=A0A7S0LG36_9EUKA